MGKRVAAPSNGRSAQDLQIDSELMRREERAQPSVQTKSRYAPANKPIVFAPRVCADCGSPAVVCVLERYRNGTPVYQNRCADCDGRWVGRAIGDTTFSTQHRLSVDGALLLAGAALFVAGFFADRAALQTTTGFGMWQILGTVGGISAIVLGALLRIDTLGLLGTGVFVGALLMDVISPAVAFVARELAPWLVPTIGGAAIVIGGVRRALRKRREALAARQAEMEPAQPSSAPARLVAAS